MTCWLDKSAANIESRALVASLFSTISSAIFRLSEFFGNLGVSFFSLFQVKKVEEFNYKALRARGGIHVVEYFTLRSIRWIPNAVFSFSAGDFFFVCCFSLVLLPTIGHILQALEFHNFSWHGNTLFPIVIVEKNFLFFKSNLMQFQGRFFAHLIGWLHDKWNGIFAENNRCAFLKICYRKSWARIYVITLLHFRDTTQE